MAEKTARQVYPHQKFALTLISSENNEIANDTYRLLRERILLTAKKIPEYGGVIPGLKIASVLVGMKLHPWQHPIEVP